VAEREVQRRLAAIVSADVVAYTRLMERDEVGTHARLRARFKALVDPKIGEHGGRVVKLMGDGMLAEFPSIIDAVNWAVDIQAKVAELSAHEPDEQRIEYRVGVNLGDVIVDGDDIYGDGVNVAARLQEIAERGGVCISEKVHTEVRGKLNVEFVDGGAQAVKNVSDPLRVWRWSPGQVEASDGVPQPIASDPLALPDKPSIAVLPFENMSADPEQAFFADGITEDIITELSRLRGFFVIARNSSFVYKGRAVAIPEVARELGVRYVLEGSVRRAGSRVRVTAQLIEAAAGAHLWAEHYDRTLDDIFELQDEITRQIVGALEPSMIGAEAERSRLQRPENLDAWGYVARALPLIWTWSEKDYAPAEALLLKAIEVDPNYARAHSILAVGLLSNAWFGRAGPHEDFVDRAIAEAKTAVDLDEQDPWGHMALGLVHGYTRNPDDAIAEMQRALGFNPNFALAHGLLGLVHAWAGDARQALQELEQAVRLSPHDVINSYYPTFRGVAHFIAGNYEAMVAEAKEGVRQRPDGVGTYRVLVVGCAHLGRINEARVAAEHLKELQPGITLGWVEQHIPLANPADRARYVEGLRKAGLPE
jgi:TolB-like protein